MSEIVLGMSLSDMRTLVKANTESTKASFVDWVRGRPQIIRDVFDICPIWRLWRVRKNAPYRITGPGSVGFVAGATEKGEVLFIAHIICPSPDANVGVIDGKVHAGVIGKAEMPKEPIRAHIYPWWLEDVTDVEGESHE